MHRDIIVKVDEISTTLISQDSFNNQWCSLSVLKAMDLPQVLTEYAIREEGWEFIPNPELYAEVATPNQIVNTDALLKELRWSYLEDSILDIGCNNGDVTKMLLSKSDQIQHITACDILGPCIDYARKENADPDITYVELDVTKEWPTTWENKYDKVFSNECLDMILDQETVMKQVFKSLKPGGEFGASYFLQVEGQQTAILTLMEKDKWRRYFQGATKSEVITCANQNIEKMIWCDKKLFSERLEENQIPSALQDEFIREMVPIVEEVEKKKFQLLSKQNCKSNVFVQDALDKKYPYCTELMIVHCVKPSN
ncbi:unnamed protein product [Owenia fusiformis]|uniref:Uncharacterized protein n=1 Tax=Owenia fusiformis TaxID=6347 RepID=A0A8J1UNW7_OWEFU|nr:unnamed protein product [Owenia fusiformis]